MERFIATTGCLIFMAACGGADDASPPPPTTSSASSQVIEAAPDAAPRDATSSNTQDTIPATPSAPPAAPPVVEFALGANGLPEDGMWKCDPILGDVNGDGKPDLGAIPRLGDGPKIWLGDGAGTWTASNGGITPNHTSCGGGVDFADVNNDGNLDFVVADHCNGVYVYLGDGKGGWSLVTTALFPEELVEDPNDTKYLGAEDLVTGDVDSDGNVDIVVAGSDESGINVYLGDGSGRSWKRQLNSLPTYGWTNRVQLHDLNGDTHLDLIASFADGPRVWLNDTKGKWTLSSVGLPSPMMRGLYTGVAIGDLNEDGRPDLAFANWVDGPEVYFQDEDDSWTKSVDVFPQMLGGAIGLDLGDVDQDGHLDIVTAGRLSLEGGFVRGVFMLRGDGHGGWTWMQGSALPSTGLSTTPGVIVGNVDSDRYPDIVAAGGLIVETVPGPPSPVIPQRIIAWRTRPAGQSSSASAE